MFLQAAAGVSGSVLLPWTDYVFWNHRRAGTGYVCCTGEGTEDGQSHPNGCVGFWGPCLLSPHHLELALFEFIHVTVSPYTAGTGAQGDDGRNLELFLKQK